MNYKSIRMVEASHVAEAPLAGCVGALASRPPLSAVPRKEEYDADGRLIQS
jgi:hypothetical protein